MTRLALFYSEARDSNVSTSPSTPATAPLADIQPRNLRRARPTTQSQSSAWGLSLRTRERKASMLGKKLACFGVTTMIHPRSASRSAPLDPVDNSVYRAWLSSSSSCACVESNFPCV